jgi:hypothetical protein
MSQVLPVADAPTSPSKRDASSLEEGEVPQIKASKPRTRFLPITVSTREEALALQLTLPSTRVFNGVNYDSFEAPLFVKIPMAHATTGVSKYGKVLYQMDDESIDAFNACLSVIALLAPQDYLFTGPGEGCDQNTVRFKWNAPKTKKCSIMIRDNCANKMPLQGDKGYLIVEISGMYRNEAIKTAGIVSRIVSFALVQ